LAVLATAGKGHPRMMLAIYIPLVILAAVCAALFMDNIAHVRNEHRAMRLACRDPHTWVISILYVGTFGSFIGFSFAFGQVLSYQFAGHFASHGVVDPVKVAGVTFLGPLIGSLIRPAGGWLGDRVGGAVTTLCSFLAMAGAAAVVLAASEQKSILLFYVGFTALFAFSGIGNGSTYKMIPAVFLAKAERAIAAGHDPDAAEENARRLAGAVIGIAAAVGAAGGVLVNIAFRQSFLAAGTGTGAYVGFIVFYLAAVALTWLAYLRPSPNRLAGV